MQIAELRDMNARLERQIDPDREKFMREMYEKEVRRTEDYYKKMLEDMREEHALALKTMEKNLSESYSSQIKELKEMIAALHLALNGSKNREKLSRGKRFGRHSEKIDAIVNKETDNDDREDEKDRFDGSGTSGTASSDMPVENPRPDERKKDDDQKAFIAKLQKKFKKMYPDAKVEVRVDYGKQHDYTENAIVHPLSEYFTLKEGEYFVTRNGQIDISRIKVIIMHPARIEEHIYETATVRSADKADYRTSSVLDLDRPVPGCTFGTDMLSYALLEKYCYNVPFDQIVVKLSHLGFRISKSTLGDILHRAIEWLREKMSETWSKAIRLAKYWMMDETPLLVGIVDKTTGEKSYRKKYVWVIRANVMKLVWFVYENGSRGLKAIESYLKDYVGFFTTDGYVVYKVLSGKDIMEGPRRSSCLVHIRRVFIEALGEDQERAMWFIEEIGKLFAIEYHCKKMGMTADERYIERLRKGSTADIMAGIEERLLMYQGLEYAGCGELMTKALRYALAEWQDMKHVLENGNVELSNNLAEQMCKHIKMNLKTASNIGSESSALDNAFMFSLIESCKLNSLSPEKYIRFLLDKLKGSDEQMDKTTLLPCYCSL